MHIKNASCTSVADFSWRRSSEEHSTKKPLGGTKSAWGAPKGYAQRIAAAESSVLQKGLAAPYRKAAAKKAAALKREETREAAQEKSRTFWFTLLNVMQLSAWGISTYRTVQKRVTEVEALSELKESSYTPKRTPKVSPDLMHEHRQDADIAYRNITNPVLFGPEGPTLHHIKQGQAGDCYFLAALDSLAAYQPDLLRKAIVDHGDGAYSVRFYYPDPHREGRWIPDSVTVDGALPRYSDTREVYAKSINDTDGNRKIWVGVMEKAMAAFNDKHPVFSTKGGEGYEGIGKGGYPHTAYSVLTGKPAEYASVKGMADSDLYRSLKDIGRHRHMTVGSMRTGEGIVGRHAYTVLGAHINDHGQYMVKLRNPWGKITPTHPTGGGDGTFEMTLPKFREYFGALFYTSKKH